MATVVGGSGNETLYGVDTVGDTIWGAGGGDVIYGGGTVVGSTGGGNDLIDGGFGSDRLYGGAGDDTLIGGAATNAGGGGQGNDTLYGGDGTDTADYSRNLTALSNAGSGSATFAVNNAAVNVNLASGVATGLGTDSLISIENVIGGGGADIITGNDGANLLAGGGGADAIYGGIGADTVEGGTGDDVLVGGADTDLLSYANSASAVNANLLAGTSTGEGTDAVSGFENLTGSSGSDILTGNGGANVIDGGAGTDRIYGGAGADTLFGGTGTTADTLYGGTGNDSIDGGAGTDLVYGGSGADSIAGGSEVDAIYGGVGNDTIDAGTGDDLVYGGPDTGTTSTGGTVAEQFNWTDYSDEVSLAAGFVQNTGNINVTVSYSGNFGGSTFTAETTGNNADPDDRNYEIYVAGGEPFNTDSSAELFRPDDGGANSSSSLQFDFAAAAGAAFQNEVQNLRFRISDIDLAGFTDSVTVRAFDAEGNEIPITITLGSAATLSQTGNTVTAIGGGLTPNQVEGSALYEIAGPVARIVVEYTDLNPNGAQQAIRVSDLHFDAVRLADNDSLIGGDGNDTMYGGIGEDTILGGIGDDRLYGGLGNDSIDAGDGTDIVVGDAGNDTLNFGSGADTVFGGAGNDLIDDLPAQQLAGANLIYGGTGNDTAYTGNDADTLWGDEGNDVLFGEGGNDLFYGGADNDQLYGGSNEDTLFGDAGNDLLYGDAGNDVLYGGVGADSAFGGDGNDIFYYGTGDFAGAANAELVGGGGTLGADINVDNDVIDLQAFGWDQVTINYTGGDPTTESGQILIYSSPDKIPANLIGVINFSEIETIIPCFTPGTLIRTARGDVPVEELCAGDLIETRDNGLQTLRWVGSRTVSRAELSANPDLQPVRIARGALGGQGPERTMLVSPQHRILIEGARAEMYFGESEVLVPAKHLVGMAEVTRALPAEGVTYVHILFDQHEIVLSDGIWTESFQPAGRTLSGLDADARREVLALFPELLEASGAFASARLSLKGYEARVLMSA